MHSLLNLDLVPLLAQEQNSVLPWWLPFVLIAIAFYFIMYLPEKRKRSETTRMLDQLKKNDRIVTIGGILGTVVNAPKGAEDVTIRIDESNNTKMRVLRSSISRVVTDEPAESKEKTEGTT